jgi:hypothetical protein
MPVRRRDPRRAGGRSGLAWQREDLTGADLQVVGSGDGQLVVRGFFPPVNRHLITTLDVASGRTLLTVEDRGYGSR